MTKIALRVLLHAGQERQELLLRIRGAHSTTENERMHGASGNDLLDWDRPQRRGRSYNNTTAPAPCEGRSGQSPSLDGTSGRDQPKAAGSPENAAAVTRRLRKGCRQGISQSRTLGVKRASPHKDRARSRKDLLGIGIAALNIHGGDTHIIELWAASTVPGV